MRARRRPRGSRSRTVRWRSGVLRGTEGSPCVSPYAFVKVLFIGDVVGATGRTVVEALLPGLQESEQPDFVVVNGENSAGGGGVPPKNPPAPFATGPPPPQ